jgi:large subunit ribosomal protein L23
MLPVTKIVKAVHITEKGARLAGQNQYLLKVAPTANKIEIREAVEKLFNVNVKKVTTINYEGKWRRLTNQVGRRPNWKKAIVTVAEGQKIELAQ